MWSLTQFASLIAQLAERETVNLEVVGSIPTWRATFWVEYETVSLEVVAPITTWRNTFCTLVPF